MDIVRAYSLAEVLVAMFLLSVAVLGLVSTHVYAAKAEQGGLERYDAGAAAASVMASIEADLREKPENFTKSYACTDRVLGEAVYTVEEAAINPRLRKFTVTIKAPTGETFKLWSVQCAR
jgi:Tfp pilus assembly protein PilV